jgi:type II secretory pathway pseudopilin PulG
MRRSGFRSAFTLLEVCIAMTIALLIIGTATLGISGLYEEQRLRRMASVIESTVRESLQQAVTQHRNIFIELGEGTISATAARGAEPRVFEFEGTLEIRRYGEKNFRAPKRGEVWQFAADGVCEPVDLRITRKGGTVEMSFDPLTGCARRKSVLVNA